MPLTGDVGMEAGQWVQWNGLPAVKNGSITTWKHSEGIENAQSHLVLAPHGAELTAGIVVDNNYTIRESGICMAWIVKPLSVHLPLSGVYEHTINGVSDGKMVVIYNARDNSFIMAKSKDNELTKLATSLPHTVAVRFLSTTGCAYPATSLILRSVAAGTTSDTVSFLRIMCRRPASFHMNLVEPFWRTRTASVSPTESMSKLFPETMPTSIC